MKVFGTAGLRAPFLRVGWNRQFLMMSEFGFVYDSSMLAPFSGSPVWPYTLDYRAPHDCVGTEQLCPTRAYPGLWELPLNQLLAGVSDHSQALRNILVYDIIFPRLLLARSVVKQSKWFASR